VAAAAEAGDIEATLRAADLEVATGQPEAGFARLIAGVAATTGGPTATASGRACWSCSKRSTRPIPPSCRRGATWPRRCS